MKHWYSKITAIILCIFTFVTVGTLRAEWIYPSFPQTITSNPIAKIGTFKFGQIYIVETEIIGGDYVNAAIAKIADTKISADIELKNSSTSTLSLDVTFYNSTSVSYFYDKTETISTNNEDIVFSVFGINRKDEIPSNTYKTISLTFSYSDSVSLTEILTELNFKFTVNKDSITDIVAASAIDRFKDILNNIVAEDSYWQLENAMNNRGGSFNKGSAVTYIGNVAGADNGDSSVINNLFGSEFMNEDLDGDGAEEPVTMMIKRLNLDDNVNTGVDYTYQGTWGRETTVRGVEMTLYITAEEIGNSDIVVYAATYTKPINSEEWTELVPLTKGTASTNNYSNGNYGTKNSFNTDTWISDFGKTIEELVEIAITG